MIDWITFSKWLPQMFYPLNLGLWLLLVAFGLLIARRVRSASFCLLFAIAILLVFSSPLSVNLYRQHEQTFLPTRIDSLPSAEAIVVLGGDVDIPLPPRSESQIRGNRALHAFRLYQAGKGKLIVVSGTNVFPQKEMKSEAVYTAKLLSEWGVPSDSIVIEDRSRNTYQNATETKNLLDSIGVEKVLLVTSAFHMPRALATFRTAGVDATPSPSGYSVADYHRPAILNWIPSLGNLGKMQAWMHEKLGIIVYRYRGWIS